VDASYILRFGLALIEIAALDEAVLFGKGGMYYLNHLDPFCMRVCFWSHSRYCSWYGV
jgi:hypothetical protein